ncbi:unnamed protein product [Oikopleura dioica]|uniref:Phosphodiesterase n=1 Tax=Oikopleura dioica TaxID=34765 RepID=E4XUV1_OIKDI|nr:unnamed protein product [Oikopleura dioica]
MAEQDGKYQDYTETFLPKSGHLRSDKEQADALDNEKTRHMNYPQDLVKSLSLIDKWEFNVFDVSDASKQRPLTYVLYELLKKYDLLSTFKIPTNVLMSFSDKVDAGYRKHRNPYHNPNHAADVAQTTHFFICQTGLLNWLSEVEVFAMIFAAAIHDYEHTGTTNTFHTQTRSPLAVLYNDRSVLENHHVAASFKMLQENKGSNIVAELTRDQFEEFRSLVVDIVLATDMSQHFQQMSQVTDALNNPKELDKVKVMALIVHLADISHAAKCWELHERWSYALTEEYFRQGDREKELGLPCSTLCDRQTVMVPQSQFGFLRFIIEPSFTTLIELFRHIADHYIAKEDAAMNSADVAEKSESSPKRMRRHIVKCRLGTSQDQGDALYPDYTYANVVARLEESGKKWIGNIESNRKKWSTLAEKEKASSSPKDDAKKESPTDSTKNSKENSKSDSSTGTNNENSNNSNSNSSTKTSSNAEEKKN